MKKLFLTAAAALMMAGAASAQSVTVYGLNGEELATYSLDNVSQIVFTPGEGDEPQTPEVEIPEGAIGINLYEGMSYEGKTWQCDIDAVCEALDLPSLFTEYVDLVWMKDGKPYINEEGGFGYTANGQGFWFNTAGEPCGWATDGCAVYIEFDEEAYGEGNFAYGQFPNTFKAGDSITINVGLMGNDNVVPFTFFFYFTEMPKLEMTVVGSQDLTAGADVTNDYTSVAAEFDGDAIVAALGVESLDQAEFLFINPDGSYEQIFTANAGYYINADGTIGSWGELSPWFIEWTGDYALSCGQYQCEPNTTYKATVAFYANQKAYYLNVTYNAGADARPAEEEE